MKMRFLVFPLLFFFSTGGLAQSNSGPAGKGKQAVLPGATTMMADACVRAAASGKKVFVLFHASWCTWCHKMDASMSDAACKDFFDQHFEIVHLVVDESKDKKHLETPGADSLRAVYKGEGLGIPFWLIVDSKGQLISDSKMPRPGDPNSSGDNAGCPASAAEVGFFIEVLKKATTLSDAEEQRIRLRFRKNEIN